MQLLKTTALLILNGILFTLSGQPHPILAQQDASLLFIKNIGQFTGEESPHFQAGWGQNTLRFSDDALWLTLVEPPSTEAEQHLNLAANPATGKVYMANTGHNSVSVIEETAVIKSVPLWDSGRSTPPSVRNKPINNCKQRRLV